MRPLAIVSDPLSLCQRWPERYPFLLQSVVHGTSQSRYDILFASSQEHLALQADGTLTRDGVELPDRDFLNALDQWVADIGPLGSPNTLPFCGGWFLYLGYELAGQIEPRLDMPRLNSPFPTAFAVRCPGAIIVDHAAEQAFAVVEPGYEDWLQRLDDDWNSCQGRSVSACQVTREVEEEDPRHFRRSLETIHQYILAGDVFQVNISRGWTSTESIDPAEAFQALRLHNPAPFAAYARWRNAAVVSSSPERLVKSGTDWVQTRPIAGTRPRSIGSTLDDDALKDELIRHPKERAEHIMLIDLERNDLGRICEPGSVEVDELMVIESYAHVHHIVSNVRGRLRSDVSAGDVVRAVFPGGTITGCPKVRCMEIIGELERQGRGPYTGSLGYLDRDGRMDLNILIRTLLVEPDGISFRAGAGIVADSETEHELEETRSKAKGLLMALQPEPDRG